MTRGRPRLPKVRRRTERVIVQASLVELAELREAADRLQVPLAVFVRAAALFAASNLSAEALGLGTIERAAHAERKEAPRVDE